MEIGLFVIVIKDPEAMANWLDVLIVTFDSVIRFAWEYKIWMHIQCKITILYVIIAGISNVMKIDWNKKVLLRPHNQQQPIICHRQLTQFMMMITEITHHLISMHNMASLQVLLM